MLPVSVLPLSSKMAPMPFWIAPPPPAVAVSVAVLDRKVGGGKSIDSYLAGAYMPRETWVVKDCEIAMAEITHEDKFKGLVEAPMSIHNCVSRLNGKLHKHNKEFMLHAIRLRGKAGVTTVPQEILKQLK